MEYLKFLDLGVLTC